jgi:hypothetical protein
MEKEFNLFLQKVYFWMFFGLVVSAVAAFIVASSETLINLIFANSWIFITLIIIELGFVFVLSLFIKKISPTTARILFIIYAILNGLTLSVILLVYTLGSIFFAFIISAIMFLLLALFGLFTKRDLSSLGTIMFVGLIAIIIALIVNIFLKNSVLDLVITILAIIIFSGLIMYDHQKLKKMSSQIRNKQILSKFAIIGALSLYLDFINLFLNILRLIGRSRN